MTKILELFKRDYDLNSRKFSSNEGDLLVPVFHWERQSFGGRTINLNHPDSSSVQVFCDLLPLGVNPEVDRFDSILGMLYLASFSPAETNWEQRASYSLAGPTQVMGPTQIIPYAIRHLKDLAKSPILKKIEEFCG